MNPTHRILVTSTTLLVLAACSGGGGGGDGSTNASGTIAFVAASPLVVSDVEPNGSVDQPQPIQDLPLAREIHVRGSIGEGDELDAFSFRVAERVNVHARLVFDAAPGRVVQLGAFDPLSMRVVARGGTQDLRFTARGAFDVVVRADAGTGPYTLALRAEPLGSRPARAGWLGALVAGDAVELAGGFAAWSASAAEEGELVVSGALEGTVRIENRTTGTSTTAGAAETRVALGLLDHVEIVGDGAAPFRVRFEPLSAAVAPRGFSRVAALSDERAAWGVDATAPLYGRPELESASGDVLVRARAGADLAADFARRSCAVRDVLPGIAQLVHVELPSGLSEVERRRATLAVARSFAASERVEYAELNLVRRPQGGGPVTPNDTHYGLQWHYPLIQLPQAWGVFGGTTNTIVAVIDTGERPHPDLNANLVAGYDFISSPTIAGDGDGRDADPFDVGDGEGPTPSSFHGTHVAGTIAAVTGNSSGIAGVCGPANRTRVMHLRALGIGGGTDADIAQAILYAAQLANGSGTLPAQRADVINMSLGGPGSNATVQSAVNSAVSAGVVVFAAAGNNNSGVAFYPASYNNVISISAVDINSNKAPYSNFNATVDLCAPGGDTSADLNNDTYADGVLSTLVNHQTGAPVFAFYQGTSMACPHAAGVAALMHSQNPSLTPAQIETMLKSTCVDLGPAGDDPNFGEGLINAFGAVLAAAGATTGSPVLAVSPTSLAFGSVEDELSFQVLNIGGGTLDVGAISDGAPWLTLVEVAGAGNTDVEAVRCQVDRTGLAVGNYSTIVTVNANNGSVPTATVNVSMVVAPAPVLVDVDLYVLAINADTLDTVAQIVLNPTTGLDYRFTDLPRGNYILVCGSDDDADDQICGENDVYCGAYPTINAPEVLPLSGGDIGGLDFVVGPESTGPTSTGSGHVFRRLD